MRWCRWAVVLGLGLAAGCSKQAGEERFTPAESNARQALETALNQWKSGQARPAPFNFGTVKVEVADQAWATGQKLQAFEIVGTEAGPTGPRVFTVKLGTGRGEQTVKYYVLGIDPLWIYGEADYRQLSGG